MAALGGAITRQAGMGVVAKGAGISKWFEGVGISLQPCCELRGDGNSPDSIGVFASRPISRCLSYS